MNHRLFRLPRHLPLQARLVTTGAVALHHHDITGLGHETRLKFELEAGDGEGFEGMIVHEF